MRICHLLLSLALLVPAIAPAAEPTTKASFDVWADAFAAEWVRARVNTPGESANAAAAETAREPGEPEENILESFQAREQRQLATARKGLAELQRWAPESLTPTQRVSAALLRWNLDLVVTGEPFTGYRFVFRQMHGLHVTLVNRFTENVTLRRRADVETFLQRLPGVVWQIDEGIAQTRVAVKRGIIPPRFILERSREQLVMFLTPEPAQNIIVTTFAQRLNGLAGLNAAARTEAIERTKWIIAAQIRPAYARVRDLLDELLPQSTDVAGISRLPGGAAAYAHALRTFTTTTMTPDEIHSLGLREVARVEGEMDRLLRELGHTEGSVARRYSKVGVGEPLPPEPDPRGVMLARYTAIIRDAEKRSERLFNLKPRATVEVRREPVLTERTAAAHYSRPVPSTGRPGIFWAPLPGPNFFFGAGMRTLAYHEAVPGHHFQNAIRQERDDLPRYRARGTFGGGSVYGEGWALYAERLAVEQGWYDGDPIGKLGALNAELFRAKRLVVDTGLHAKGWTRQQAIDYGISAQEVERYVVWPGQACSYMVGMLRIPAVREKAKAALGDKFSLPAFHDVVLKTGSVPLEVLAEVVAAWAAERGAVSAKTE